MSPTSVCFAVHSSRRVHVTGNQFLDQLCWCLLDVRDDLWPYNLQQMWLMSAVMDRMAAAWAWAISIILEAWSFRLGCDGGGDQQEEGTMLWRALKVMRRILKLHILYTCRIFRMFHNIGTFQKWNSERNEFLNNFSEHRWWSFDFCRQCKPDHLWSHRWT